MLRRVENLRKMHESGRTNTVLRLQNETSCFGRPVQELSHLRRQLCTFGLCTDQVLRSKLQVFVLQVQPRRLSIDLQGQLLHMAFGRGGAQIQ